jgi:urease accessory protein
LTVETEVAGRASSVLLTLADGRFPAGGHAHSGGLEEAVYAGRARDAGDLLHFLAGRLGTVGRVEAALSTMSWSCAPEVELLVALQAEVEARSPSPALRHTSRAQGRGLLRAARAIWPDDLGWLDQLAHRLPRGAMYPVALGAVGRSIGLGPDQVAIVAAQASVSGPGWAATRLLGLDPFAVASCLAELAPAVDKVAADAAAFGRTTLGMRDTLALLPAYAAPLLELGAENHARWEVRLFAS